MNDKETSTLRTIIDALPLGYLYLLLLGIVSDSIFYGLIGINIISYSTILDVLLGPVVHLTESLIFPIAIILLPIMMYFYLKLVIKLTTRKKQNAPNLIVKFSLNRIWLFMTALVIFSAFIGFGLGGGLVIKKKIQDGDFTSNTRISFVHGNEVDVKVVGNNSTYIFYVEKGNRFVTISPIQNNISKIEKIGG